jgi:hypothetical protein
MVNHFLRITIFFRIFISIFPIYSMILCMPIPIVYFSRFLPWESHSHFIGVTYTTWGPIGRKVITLVHFCVFRPIATTHPIYVFPLLVDETHIMGLASSVISYFFMITVQIFKIKDFNVVNELCSMVSIGVGPLYITSSWLFYSQRGFLYFGCIGGIQIIH